MISSCKELKLVPKPLKWTNIYTSRREVTNLPTRLEARCVWYDRQKCVTELLHINASILSYVCMYMNIIYRPQAVYHKTWLHASLQQVALVEQYFHFWKYLVEQLPGNDLDNVQLFLNMAQQDIWVIKTELENFSETGMSKVFRPYTRTVKALKFFVWFVLGFITPISRPNVIFRLSVRLSRTIFLFVFKLLNYSGKVS